MLLQNKVIGSVCTTGVFCLSRNCTKSTLLSVLYIHTQYIVRGDRVPLERETLDREALDREALDRVNRVPLEREALEREALDWHEALEWEALERDLLDRWNVHIPYTTLHSTLLCCDCYINCSGICAVPYLVPDNLYELQ